MATIGRKLVEQITNTAQLPNLIIIVLTIYLPPNKLILVLAQSLHQFLEKLLKLESVRPIIFSIQIHIFDFYYY